MTDTTCRRLGPPASVNAEALSIRQFIRWKRVITTTILFLALGAAVRISETSTSTWVQVLPPATALPGETFALAWPGGTGPAVPRVTSARGSPPEQLRRDFVEHPILDPVAFPVSVVEVPPLVLVDSKALGLHRVTQQLAVPARQ